MNHAEGDRYSAQGLTPKAFANWSPGFEAQREPWDPNENQDQP